MYTVEYENGAWWIKKDGTKLEILGSFIDPITPKIIVGEIEKNGEV